MSDGTLKSFDSGKMLNRAKQVVEDYIAHPNKFEIRTVWFAKALGNWKAILCTDLPDNLLYEITYNGEKKETYLDVYDKIENVRIPDGTE